MRVAGLFLAGIVVFLALQALLVPEGFGDYGHYRAGALDDARARPVAFAGRAACVECHADVAGAAKGSATPRIGCEACHGALAAHAGGPDEAQAGRDRIRACSACAATPPNVGASPKSFPQVDPPSTRGDGPCTDCHVRTSPRIGRGGELQ